MPPEPALDRERFSRIAHGELALWNPVGPDVLDAWVDGLAGHGVRRALDVGCGRGELLVRLALAHAAAGLGIDPNAGAIELAREAAQRRAPEAALSFRCERFDAATLPVAHFDLVACIGATHAIGDLAATLDALIPLLRPGGLLWVGEGYWRREPPPAYLAFLGAERDELRSHRGNLELGGSRGLESLRDHEASPGEWSHYEDSYAENVECFLAAHPGDPEAPAMRARIRAWRAAYLEHGRETLGFGLYLWRVPEPRSATSSS